MSVSVNVIFGCSAKAYATCVPSFAQTTKCVLAFSAIVVRQKHDNNNACNVVFIFSFFVLLRPPALAVFNNEIVGFTIQKSVEVHTMPPVPRFEALALPDVVERATRSPRRLVYIIIPMHHIFTHCHIYTDTT